MSKLFKKKKEIKRGPRPPCSSRQNHAERGGGSRPDPHANHTGERERGPCDGGREREHRPALAPVPRCAAGHGRGPAKRERGRSGESQNEGLGSKAKVLRPSTPRRHHHHRRRVSPGTGDPLCTVVDWKSAMVWPNLAQVEPTLIRDSQACFGFGRGRVRREEWTSMWLLMFEFGPNLS